MKRRKELVLAAALVMTIGMAACNRTNNQPSSEVPSETTVNFETMTVNSFDIEITSVPYQKYQKELLKNSDYYIDALEEPDSPAFVCIGPAGKSVYRDVVDVQVDDSQNVTITVCEVEVDRIASERYPITEVTIYPFPASITVVDDQGNTLKE